MTDKKPINSMYDNPMTRAALNSMNPETIEEYKKIGENMYENIDMYQGVENPNQLPPFLIEPLKYIKEGLKSGLHPSDMEESDIKVIEECLGEKWYEQFGYVESDLKQITTVKQTKH